MSSPPGNQALFRASGFRLAAFYAFLLTIAFIATAVTVWFSATALAENALRQKIELEADALAHELDAEGASAVEAAIAARMERPGAPEYWLIDASGRRLIGDAPAMEGPNGWRKVDLRHVGETAGPHDPDELIVLTRSFPNGMRLSVGEDLAEGRRIIAMTISVLAQAGAASVMLVLLVGFMVTRNSLRRLKDISAALESVGAGDLNARAPVRRQFFLTDLENVADGINRMLDRNESLVSGLRRVTRDVAHDLRTPLTHLRQRMEKARAAEGPLKNEAILSAEEKAGQIVKTFDAILRLAEIETGSAKSRFKHVDLVDIAGTVVDAYGLDAEHVGKTIFFRDAPPSVVEGDRELLMQAVANLLDNALKHTAPGATVNISVTQFPKPTIIVLDSGGGIPPEEIQAVMEPFYRRDQSRTTEGAGLGLSIVRAIANLHDAALVLQTHDGAFEARIEFEPPRNT